MQVRIHIISMITDKTSSKTHNAHYEIRLNIIEYNGIFYTCGREAVSLVSSDHSYTEPISENISCSCIYEFTTPYGKSGQMKT